MIPDMTIGQLMNEASSRYGDIWDPYATRMTLLLLCPRKERKMMELHGDMIDHGQPVVSVFHRPRAEAHLLEEQGFDPRAASFMFVNIATADMGPWMQQLVNNEGWLRNSIQLASTPFSVGLPSQRPFEALQTLCFRHPSLPSLERYFLPFPADSLPGKCFVSLPRRAAAEMARQQAEVLGARDARDGYRLLQHHLHRPQQLRRRPPREILARGFDPSNNHFVVRHLELTTHDFHKYSSSHISSRVGIRYYLG